MRLLQQNGCRLRMVFKFFYGFFTSYHRTPRTFQLGQHSVRNGPLILKLGYQTLVKRLNPKYLKNLERSIRYKFDKSKYPSFNNPDGYLSREKCAKLTKLFIVVGVTAVCDQEFVQLKIIYGFSEFVLRIHDLCTCKRILNISNLDSSVI